MLKIDPGLKEELLERIEKRSREKAPSGSVIKVKSRVIHHLQMKAEADRFAFISEFWDMDEPRTLLIHMLRDILRLTGSHIRCVVGKCGACTVLRTGRQVKSCMVFAMQTAGTEIITIEGLANKNVLHPL